MSDKKFMVSVNGGDEMKVSHFIADYGITDRDDEVGDFHFVSTVD